MQIRKLSDDELKELKRRARRDRTRLLDHLILAYETIFRHACDENSDVLDFKPEIAEALELRKTIKSI
jgi:hypothetical protein